MTKPHWTGLLTLAFMCFVLGISKGFTQADETPPTAAGESPFPQRFDAPSFEGGHGWLNTSEPLDWKDLKGKVVLIDFWTYCCINCMHVLPDLEYLENKYPNELVVIGVHSAKFENEQDTSAIRSAIQRYEIKHPVINDADMKVWQKFGSRSWPTLVIVDPEGKYIGYVSGEGNRKTLDGVISKLIDYHRTKGTLNEEPLKFELEAAKLAKTPLQFPGKVLADAENNWLFISDSNHNRIVVCRLDGTLVDVIGNGKEGLKDGSYSDAQFDHPQGMELVGTKLYVADTESHAVRVIDLMKKTVETLAGNGEQSRFRDPGGSLKEVSLNSPWAISELDGTLYIAMAGPHQLFKHKLGSQTIEVFAGSGREDIIDGSLTESALAQPSGITHDGKTLYFVDSEGSAVRKVDMENKTVTTIAGPRDLPQGRSLFEFGDIDKPGAEARFQHPIGVVYHNNKLYVADSYNHKIRTIDLTTGEVSSLLGTGTAGNTLGETPQLSEPAGLSVANDTLYIADTNNHRILTVNLKDNSMQELKIMGLKDPE
ncbi:thioredoxin-like domain-containing protein [Rubinisphaera italica]|uniref:Thiol-disulfide oxidoreductase YkuV n=1 Tax=Rubinisphaera italica TaxID=2527969 RepID=A0A5C5XBS9_9PLAN|nr:thioredoxin-like domain-containing protein [Rubinisphaera italica]TWT59881.1 Thiol-disulfide oxidoreductase YkuV [Rubinisphaera italica]